MFVFLFAGQLQSQREVSAYSICAFSLEASLCEKTFQATEVISGLKDQFETLHDKKWDRRRNVLGKFPFKSLHFFVLKIFVH